LRDWRLRRTPNYHCRLPKAPQPASPACVVAAAQCIRARWGRVCARCRGLVAKLRAGWQRGAHLYLLSCAEELQYPRASSACGRWGASRSVHSTPSGDAALAYTEMEPPSLVFSSSGARVRCSPAFHHDSIGPTPRDRLPSETPCCNKSALPACVSTSPGPTTARLPLL
jgi:hypothetical protein